MLTRNWVALWFGLSLALSLTDAYEHLNIAIVSGYSRMPGNVQNNLQNSLTWFKNAITVTKLRRPITSSELLRIYPKFSFVNIQTSQQNTILHVKSPELSTLLKNSNFVILVNRNVEKCQKDTQLLATAKPLPPELFSERPRFGTMNLCDNLRFANLYDLFRHEILHALGYGLFLPSDEPKPIQNYNWWSPRGVQTLNRTFLDFSKKAEKAVSVHFNCATFGGVEADGEKKNHLNEYIFGNELMTPNLEMGRNYFSEISAAILEETFFGEIQWYVVNRTFTKSESQQYWYGKNFGCDFLNLSCWTFLKRRELNALPTFPFCSKNNEKFCLQTSTSTRRLANRCQSQQSPIYRYCPIDKDFFNLPPNHQIVAC